MINALVKAVSQMFTRPLMGIFLTVIGLTLVALIIFFSIVTGVINAEIVTGWSWLDSALSAGATIVALALTYILFVPIAMIIAGLFQDKVVDAVERTHYPHLPPAAGLPLASVIWAAIRLFAWSLVLNLLALPLYLIPGFNLVVFLALNGYLLAREYFEIVALRRLSPLEASVLRRNQRVTFWVAGIIIALGFVVPVVNLMTPIIGTAFMVHVYQSTQPSSGA